MTPIELRADIQIRPVPGYEAFYSASSDGRVFSNNYRGTGKLIELAQSALIDRRRASASHYMRVKAARMNRNGPTAVHRIVALTFVDNPHGWNNVNHINGIKSDNRAENLEWCSASRNAQHAIDTGLLKRPKGEDHNCAKLQERAVVAIRDELARTPPYKGQLTELAARYGVSKHCIYDVKARRSWTHLP